MRQISIAGEMKKSRGGLICLWSLEATGGTRGSGDFFSREGTGRSG